MRFLISFLALVGVAVSGALVYPCTETTLLTNVTKNINDTESGPANNGYYYEVWTNSPGGPSNISLYDKDAAFKAEWDLPDDFLGRVGQRWPSRTGDVYSTYGNIVAEYAYTRSGQRTAGERYNFIGVYGWAYADEAKGIPLVEYYIIDDWFGNDEYLETDPIPESTACHDSDPGWVCQKGSFNVDGAEYKIYTNWRVNKPSIVGDTTFLQYFSIRQATRKCGKITVSEHFKKWNSLNLQMGILFEASLLVEVENGTGFVDYTHAKVLLDVPASDLDFTPRVYAAACPDRTPSGGSCVDAKDLWDELTPPCYVQPDNAKCATSCPLDYEAGTGADTGKCVLINYNDEKCRARVVQKTGCKDATGAGASCDLFGCGPYCYLNVAKKGCSLPCVAGEAAVAGTDTRHCERAPCPDRIPRSETQSSSSHSLSNDAVNYDVTITLEKVVFTLGWKSTNKVTVAVDGEAKTSTAVVGDAAEFIFNEVFEWSDVAPTSLTSVSVRIDPIGGSGTIDISASKYKVGSAAEGAEITSVYTDTSGGPYSNSYEVFFKVAVVCPSGLSFAGSECVPNTNWRCGSPIEDPLCYQNENTCTLACTGDATTGSCIPDGAARAAHWGGWALCLLIVVLFL